MKRYWKMTLGAIALVAMGCSRTPETLDSNDTVNVSTNQQNAEATTTTTTTTTSSTTATPTDGTTTTAEQNALAKEAIKEIETAKQVILDDHYTILIQAQTENSIDINVRHNEQSNVSSTYGFFRYHKDTRVLEEMDPVSGDYKPIRQS